MKLDYVKLQHNFIEHTNIILLLHKRATKIIIKQKSTHRCCFLMSQYPKSEIMSLYSERILWSTVSITEYRASSTDYTIDTKRELTSCSNILPQVPNFTNGPALLSDRIWILGVFVEYM
jgi:ribonuclease HIII